MKTTGQQGIFSRVPLSYMGRLTVGSLVGIGIGFWALLMTIGVTVLAIVILAVVSIAIAALVFSGVRWMPALAALYGVGIWIGGPTSQPYSLYHLTHPQEGGPFIASVLVYVLAIVTIVAGTVATMENYRGGERRAPGWINPFLGMMAGFIIGASVVSLLVLPGNTPAAQSNQATEAGIVHMGIASFTQQTITITKGSTLKLVDDGNFTHIIANGSWDGSTPKPASEPGAPVVRNVQVNGGSITIGPFSTAGTYSIYCTIHRGMMLKVIVQ